MDLILISIFFVLGLIIGSFLNVVICRFGTHKTFGGRSACMNCNNKIPWYDMFPVASFCALGGKCRHCQSKISVMYPTVEFITGLVFAFLFVKFHTLFFYSILDFVFVYSFYAVFFSLLIVVAVYDLRHKIIPDFLSLVLGILAFAGLFIINNFSLDLHLPNLGDFLAGIFMALPFAILWAVSRGRWMGFGDAKLSLSLGWILGGVLMPSAFILAFWIGALVGVVLMLASKKYRLKTELPFAPFLAVATILTFLFNINLVKFFTGF